MARYYWKIKNFKYFYTLFQNTMKGKSLFWAYITFILVVLINISVFGVSYAFLFDEYVFYGLLILGVLSFLFYASSLNLSAFLLMSAFYLNLLLLSLQIVSGRRSLLIAISCILALFGILDCIMKMGRVPSKSKVAFPEPTIISKGRHKSSSRQSKRQALDKELGPSSLSKPEVETYTGKDEESVEIKNILKEIEDKAKELNKEIKTVITSEKHKPIGIKSKKPSPSKKQVYVAGKNSAYYHSEDCPIAKRVKKRRVYETKEKAENAGLKPHFCVK